MTDNVQALISAVLSNDELHAKTKSIEEGLKEDAEEYIALAAKNGIKLELEDFTEGNTAAIQKLIDAEKDNPALKEQAAELEKKLQGGVDDYIALAREYGLTLTPEDFNPNGANYQ